MGNYCGGGGARAGLSPTAKNTLASGATWEIAFSRDAEQRFIYLTDGQNERVRIVKRATITELASFGPAAPAGTVLWRAQHRGPFQGQHLHYETYEGKRIEKFVSRASAACRPASKAHSGRSAELTGSTRTLH